MIVSSIPSSASDEEISRIDRFVERSSEATPYHSIRWLRAIEKAYGYESELLVAEDASGVSGVLPLCRFKGLTGIEKYCSLPYCDVGGAIAEDDATRSQLVEHALKSAANNRIKFIELRQRYNEDEPGLDMTGRKVSMMLDLPESSEMLMSGFKSKLRSQIKKAEKNGLIFDSSSDADSIKDFYSVYSRNMHQLGSPTHSLKLFTALMDAYRDDMLVGRVWYGDKVIGAGVLLFSGENVCIPWASTLREHNRLAPNMLLYWNLLRLSCIRGCNKFDFGRSTFGEGTYNFKKQWGASPILLDWKVMSANGEIMDSTVSHNEIRRYVEMVWMKMPLQFANLMGPLIRKRLSL